MNDYTHHDWAAATRFGQYLSKLEEDLVLRAHASAREPSLALDVGAAGGRWSRLLNERGWQNICTDVNARSVERVSQVLPEARCFLVDPEDTRLPADDGQVGMALCIEVFAVMPTDWFIDESARVLQKGGILVGEFNNKWSWRGALHHAMTKVKGGFDYYRSAYPLWKKRLRAAGFEIEYEGGAGWMPFGRHSNSALVPLSVQVEKSLGLNQLPDLSPTAMFIARKTA